MRKISLVTILSVAATGLLVLSCSDSNKKTQGDPNDTAYLQAQGLTDAYVDSLIQAFGFASGYVYFDGTEPLRATSDSLNINFDQGTCWWEIYASSDTNGLSTLFIDSLTFQDIDGCQMLPDSGTTTQIEYRAMLDFSAVMDSGSATATASQDMLITGIQAPVVFFNSAGAAQVSFVFGVIPDQSILYYSYNGLSTDVAFDRDSLFYGQQAYPLSGNINLSMVLDLTSPQGNIHSAWTYDITLYTDHYHVYAESGDNYWEWDHQYQSGPLM